MLYYQTRAFIITHMIDYILVYHTMIGIISDLDKQDTVIFLLTLLFWKYDIVKSFQMILIS